MITEQTTFAQLSAILDHCGIRVDGLTSTGGHHVARMTTVNGQFSVEAHGATMARALEDGRVSLARARVRATVEAERKALEDAVSRHFATPCRETEAAVNAAARAYGNAVVLLNTNA